MDSITLNLIIIIAVLVFFGLLYRQLNKDDYTISRIKKEDEKKDWYDVNIAIPHDVAMKRNEILEKEIEIDAKRLQVEIVRQNALIENRLRLAQFDSDLLENSRSYNIKIMQLDLTHYQFLLDYDIRKFEQINHKTKIFADFTVQMKQAEREIILEKITAFNLILQGQIEGLRLMNKVDREKRIDELLFGSNATFNDIENEINNMGYQAPNYEY